VFVVISDQTIVLADPRTARDDPGKPRRVRFRDDTKSEAWTYLANDFALPALVIAELYRSRRPVELFFKWIKQHLRITPFHGTSPNAVRTQIWIAVTTHVLAAVIRKRLEIDRSLHNLQVLSVSLRENPSPTTTVPFSS
jgi:IS4 transposase